MSASHWSPVQKLSAHICKPNWVFTFYCTPRHSGTVLSCFFQHARLSQPVMIVGVWCHVSYAKASVFSKDKCAHMHTLWWICTDHWILHSVHVQIQQYQDVIHVAFIWSWCSQSKQTHHFIIQQLASSTGHLISANSSTACVAHLQILHAQCGLHDKQNHHYSTRTDGCTAQIGQACNSTLITVQCIRLRTTPSFLSLPRPDAARWKFMHTWDMCLRSLSQIACLACLSRAHHPSELIYIKPLAVLVFLVEPFYKVFQGQMKVKSCSLIVWHYLLCMCQAVFDMSHVNTFCCKVWVQVCADGMLKLIITLHIAPALHSNSQPVWTPHHIQSSSQVTTESMTHDLRKLSQIIRTKTNPSMALIDHKDAHCDAHYPPQHAIA